MDIPKKLGKTLRLSSIGEILGNTRESANVPLERHMENGDGAYDAVTEIIKAASDRNQPGADLENRINRACSALVEGKYIGNVPTGRIFELIQTLAASSTKTFAASILPLAACLCSKANRFDGTAELNSIVVPALAEGMGYPGDSKNHEGIGEFMRSVEDGFTDGKTFDRTGFIEWRKTFITSVSRRIRETVESSKKVDSALVKLYAYLFGQVESYRLLNYLDFVAQEGEFFGQGDSYRSLNSELKADFLKTVASLAKSGYAFPPEIYGAWHLFGIDIIHPILMENLRKFVDSEDFSYERFKKIAETGLYVPENFDEFP